MIEIQPKQQQTEPVQFLLCLYFSYRDYRSNEDYTLTSQFWFVLAMRFVFVILFEVWAPSRHFFNPNTKQSLQ